MDNFTKQQSWTMTEKYTENQYQKYGKQKQLN